MSLSKTRSVEKGTTARVEKRLGKTRVHLEYTCFVCGDVLTRANIAVSHVRRLHGYDIPTRPVGRRRPQSHEFEYVDNKNQPHDTEDYACPSCWFHCPKGDLEVLNIHTRTEHDVIKVDDTKKKNTEYVPSASVKSLASRCLAKHGDTTQPTRDNGTPGNVATTEIAHKLDELTDLFKNFFK